MNDRAAFAKLATALSPWANQLVFVGGWAHRLYRLHPKATAPAYQPLATLDADVAFGDRERFDGSIKSRLQEAGFHEELAGIHQPPVSHYMLGKDEQGGFYAEFLTPLIGREITKDGKRIATVAVAEITAQKLRYLELLLKAPWTVTLNGEQWDLKSALDLRVPNPVTFIVQKLLIHDVRPEDKKAQDILYIHDTLELFAAALDDLAVIWRDEVKQALHANWLQALTRARETIFARLNDRLRDAAAIPQDRDLDPERMRAMCFAALTQILG